MITSLCTCPDGLGLHHDHVRVPVMADTVDRVLTMQPTSRVRIHVDWREVARAVAQVGEETER